MDIAARSDTDGLVPARRQRNRLSIYSTSSLNLDEVESMATEAGGLVLPGKQGFTLARRLIRERRYTGELRLDAIRYLRSSEDQPAHRQECLIDEWLIKQQGLGVTELMTAPEQMLPDGDINAVQKQLNDDEWPPESRVVLALEGAWLSHHPGELAREIRRAARPVAVALRASHDPLGSLPRLQGLMLLTAPDLDVMLMRTDFAGIGALAAGLRSAALGVSTYTRHIPAPRPRRDTDRPEPARGTDVYIPALGAHHWAATLQMMDAAGTSSLRGLDLCWCAHCEGRSLTRFAYRVDRDAGRAHDVAALLDLARELDRQPPERAEQWWHQHCSRALDAHRWLRRELSVAVPEPPALVAWTRLGPQQPKVPSPR